MHKLTHADINKRVMNKLSKLKPERKNAALESIKGAAKTYKERPAT